MKKWLKEIWEVLTEPWISLLTLFILAIIMGLLLRFTFYLGGWAAKRGIVEWENPAMVPEICALCETGASLYRAPCVVSLGSGKIRELELYRTWAGESMEESNNGYAYFTFFDGVCISGNMTDHTCELALPEEMKRLDGTYFCRDCRAELAEISTEGYVLADLYDAEHFALYPITAGAEYDIREYTVTVSQDEESGRFIVRVTGNG